MLKLLERSIALQLLVFYCLFIIPLILGGAELYLFQHDALQQNTRRNELGFAQAISLQIATHTQDAIAENAALAASQAARRLNLPELASLFTTSQLSHPDIDLYFVCDSAHHLLLSYPPATPAQARQQKSMCDYIPPAQALHNSNPSLSPGRVSPTTQTNVISITSRIIDDRGNTTGIVGLNLSLAQFTSRLETIQRQLSPDREARIWIADERGRLLASTEHSPSQTDLRKNLPGLTNALHGEQGSLIAHEHDRDWLYSYLPVTGTRWAIVVQRPTDVTFSTIISFQNSLLIALVTLIIGASFFWFTLHGWVVAPLVKLTRAVSMVRPDQTSKVTDSELLAKDRTRIDEIGRLIAAISTMENEIHDLFSKTDAKSQARLHMLDAIMRSMSEGMLLERPDGRIMYANQSFTQLVGIAPQEFLLEDSFNESQVEEKLLEIIEDPAAYREAIRNAENSSSPRTIEFQVRGFYNHIGQFVPARRDIRVRLFQVRDRAGQLIGRGKIFRDVTRNNEAEQIKKNLLAIVSHELRTPLTAIKGYATSLLETDVELDEELQQHFLQAIVGESDRMADLVTSLLDMSQLDAGALKLSLSLQHLEPLIKQVVPADMRGRMRIQIPENLPLLLIDRRRMEVVLRNLVENTRRHAGASATIEFTARYEQDRPEGGLYLSIADDGPGFPPDLTERIFDRFYQVDGSRQRRSGGVGLGLAICRGFVEAHGGRIWAENRTDGKTGAVFHIWLPSTVLYVPGTQHIYFHELVD